MAFNIHNVITILSSIAAFLYFNMGMDYLNLSNDYGMHPLVAFPVAAITFLIACSSCKLIILWVSK